MIGAGSASCSETLACVRGIEESDEGPRPPRFVDQPYTSQVSDCMIASDPEVSKVLSNAVGCVAGAPQDMVDELCAEQIAACEAR